MTRRFAIIIIILVCITLVVPLNSAHSGLFSYGFDSSLTAGLLFGTMSARYQDNLGVNEPYFTVGYNTSLPLVGGMCELSPLELFSARIGGALSVLETEMTVTNVADNHVGSIYPWEVLPSYRSWEAAGLYHLSRGFGYRFSLVGGYREQYWTYRGNQLGLNTSPNELKDYVRSLIPFGGFQTAMFFPWWKARFEFSGSPLVIKNVFSRHRDNTATTEFDGWLKNGVMFDFLCEGAAVLTDALRCGLYGRYTYQEISGIITRRIDDGTKDEYDIDMNENLAVVGINLTYAF